MNTQISDDRRKEIYKPMERQIQLCNFTDADLFRMLAEAIADNTTVAIALAQRISELLDAAPDNEEFSYSGIIAQAYYDIFFDPRLAQMYSTTFICFHEDMMEQFVVEHVRMLQEDYPLSIDGVSANPNPNSTH